MAAHEDGKLPAVHEMAQFEFQQPLVGEDKQQRQAEEKQETEHGAGSRRRGIFRSEKSGHSMRCAA